MFSLPSNIKNTNKGQSGEWGTALLSQAQRVSWEMCDCGETAWSPEPAHQNVEDPCVFGAVEAEEKKWFGGGIKGTCYVLAGNEISEQDIMLKMQRSAWLKKHTGPRLEQILCASNTDEICLLRCNFSERQTNNLSNCLFQWRERRFSGWFYIQYLPFSHLANASVRATSSEAQSSQQATRSFVTKNTTLEAKTLQYKSSATNLCRNCKQIRQIR